MTIDRANTPQGIHGFGPNLWLQIAGSIVLLGLLADALFNGATLGLNVPLWVGALIAVLVLAARRGGRSTGRLSAGLLAASLGLSVMIAWRSAEALQIVLLITSICLLLLALVTRDGSRARRVGVAFFFAALLRGALSAVEGAILLPRSIPWGALFQRDARRQAHSVGRAVLIAAPLVLIFGGLFFAADAVFEAWIRSSVTIAPSSLAEHLGWSLGGSAAAAGLLWCGLATEPVAGSGPQLADDRRLRAIETAVVLGSLVALFGLFVAIQVQYLFGGEGHVQASTGLTYAQYARRGFFELVAVAALLLPVLLGVDWARERHGRSRTTFRVLAGLLVLLLAVVMTSAFQRLRIYVDVFGLTALRFYAAALLAWLAAVFAWLSWSLLRERRDEFVAGAVLTALVALVTVVAVNPHGMIAATNLARAEEGRDFDVPHALGLSADATPTLLDGIDALEESDACEVSQVLLERWDDADLELRSWNWSRSSAAAAVGANRDRLLAACG